MRPCPWHVAAFKTIKPAHQKKGKACKKSAQPVHKAHGAGIGALTPQPVLPSILIHNAGAHQIHGGDGAGVAEAEQAGSGERRHKTGHKIERDKRQRKRDERRTPYGH